MKYEMKNKPTVYSIEEQLANEILQYLSKQPYAEVAKLINGLQTGLTPIAEKIEKEEIKEVKKK